ncbi:MAG: PAS domain-containing protein [Planctomycetes bacterium]|nr:PAS domain-containing protein [Planctomycetota bacterium]
MAAAATVFSAMLAGAAFATTVIALLFRSTHEHRRLAMPFSFLSLAMCAFAISQIYRNACPDLETADWAARCVGASSSLVALFALVLYRTLTCTRGWRFDGVLLALLGASSIYALCSPAGTLFVSVQRIDTIAASWWGPITVLHGEPDQLHTLIIALYAILIARLLHLGVGELRRDRIAGVMLIVPATVMLLPVVHGYGLVRGWWSGIPLGEYAMSTLYLVLGLVLWRREQAFLADIALRRAQIEAVLDHGLGLSGLLTPDGRLVLANRTALAIAGTSVAQVIGRSFPDTPWWNHDPEARKRIAQAVARAANGESDRFTTTHPRPDGSLVDIDFSLTPYRDRSGRITYLIAEGRDISELRRLDRMVREGSRLDALGQLAGGMAHDFNNALAGIMGAAELAKMRSQDTEVRRRLDTVLSTAAKAGDLTRRMLSFARKGKGQEVELAGNTLVRECVELLARSAGPDIRIETRLDAARDGLRGDPAELQSALLNLCINARDAMPEGGCLTLSTSVHRVDGPMPDAIGDVMPPGTYLRIDVEDTGCGIPAEMRERIFEPFFTTKPAGKGTGLGLPAVLGTVQAHSGGLLLRSSPGAGTSISVLLPLQGDSSASIGAASTAYITHGDGSLVVLVDDDGQVRQLARELLGNLGLQVEDHGDPRQARDRLRRLGDVRCVILDLAMPGLNGRDLYAFLRATSRELPIIISSGHVGGGHELDTGADPQVVFMPKPWRLAQLQEALVQLRVLKRG